MQKFNFWKDNRVDQHFILTVEQITDQFIESEQYTNYTKGWPLQRALSVFIAATLHAVNEFKEFDDMFLAVRQEMKRRHKQ